MRNILSIIILITLASCHFDNLHNDNYIQPELDSVITEFIKKHPEDSIYTLSFYKFNNKHFFDIYCSGTYYDSNFIDVCFYKNNKIIVAWSINNSLMDSLINIPPSNQCYDSLKNFNDRNESELMYSDKNVYAESYRILGSNNYRIANKLDYALSDTAHSSNVIKSQAVNRILNDYLNSYYPHIAYLRFDTLYGRDYMWISNDFVYDKEAFSGMFYRDGRIVVLYDLNRLKTQDLIDKTQLLPITELKDYKAVKRKYARFQEYRYIVASKEKIIKVPLFGYTDMD